MATTTTYPFDPTGKLASNKITSEQHILTGSNAQAYYFIVPDLAPYFTAGLVVSFKPVSGSARILVEGIDYYCTHWFISASRSTAYPIYGSISFLDIQLIGVVTLSYQTLGGEWTQSNTKLAEILSDHLRNPRTTAWDVIVDMPVIFPPIDHAWDLQDLVGASGIVTSIATVEAAIRNKVGVPGPQGIQGVPGPTGTMDQATINSINSSISAINSTLLTVGKIKYVDKGSTTGASTQTITMDISLAGHQKLTVVNAFTLQISNWFTSGITGELMIELVNGGLANITWPSNINWVRADGTTVTSFSTNGITLQSAGTDFIMLWSHDAGTTIYGKIMR